MLHFIYYSTNISTEYFKHAAHSPFSSLQNAVYFIMLPFLVPVLFTFYIESVLKFKKKHSGAKGLTRSPGHFTPGKRPGNRCIGDGVVPRAVRTQDRESQVNFCKVSEPLHAN